MKRIITLLILLCVFGASYALNGTLTQTLTVTSVESAPVTGITVITYDLQTAQGPVKVNETTYNISVEVSFDGGGSYTPVPSEHLSGDVVSVSVSPGMKQITWDGGASFPNKYSEATKVRLTASPICGTYKVTFMYNDSEVTYGTVAGANGTCWLDRNLGATQVATSSNDHLAYGDLFQWGRGADGHQDRSSGLTAGPTNNHQPGTNFITVTTGNWYNGTDQVPNDLWKEDGTGINNPCPPGWRVPTETELVAEKDSWGTGNQNAAGAFDSDLKWPVGGHRYGYGTFDNVGSFGGVWSSSVSGFDARNLFFGSVAGMDSNARAYGVSVRCVRDDTSD